MEYCPHCMRPAQGRFCRYCGGSLEWTAAPGQLPVSTLLRGSEEHTYQIGAARGQGGFGITYAAMDLVTGQRVAIKEYFPTRCSLRNAVNQVVPMTGQESVYRSGMESFLEEAMMLSAVGALPSVVTVRDYFEANGTAYLVMEYVDGVPLHQIVTEKGKMSATELLPKLRTLLMDLETLHRAGIIHRDISPDNLILMPDGTLKLLDFGSARSVQDGKSMTVLLKAGFSPIEQYQSRGQGPWSDVYALSGTVYYCLTGVLPPASVDRLEEDTLRRPNEFGAGLTPGQEEAILWGLVLQPKARPASMEQFCQRLFAPGAAAPAAPQPQPVPAQPKPQPVPAPASQPAPVPQPRPQPPVQPQPVQMPVTQPVSEAQPMPQSVQTPPVSEQQPAPAPQPKKKKSKALLIVLIAVGTVALLTLAGIIGFYALTHGTTDSGLTYTLTLGRYATVTGYKAQDDDVVIPEEIRDLPVKYIEEGAFEKADEIVTITVPTDVYPFAKAFSGCDSVVGVILQGTDDIWPAWESALRDCKSLAYVLFTDTKAYEYCVERGRLDELSDVVVCCLGQDTGWGRIRSVEASGGIVYAFTDQQTAVILHLPEGVDGDLLAATIGSYQVILPDGRYPGQPRFITGVTEDGFLYEIPDDGSYCAITGYQGSDTYVYIPDTVNGAPVTVISERAFANNSKIQSVFFSTKQKEIRAGAFENCSNLRDIYVYTKCSVDSTAFKNCGRLRCAVLGSSSLSLSGWTLPSDLCVLYYGMETGAGALDYVGVDDQGVVYGVTDDDDVVVMDLPVGVSEITLLRTVYGEVPILVHANAVNGLSSSTKVWLPSGTVFPYEIWNAVDWEFLDSDNEYTYAECWWYTCYACAQINKKRGNNDITPDPAVMMACMARAEERYYDYSDYRPNGDKWSTILDEYDVDYSYAYAWQGRYSNSSFNSEFWSDFQTVADFCSTPAENYHNKYFEKFGLGLYYDSAAGNTYLFCIGIITD